MFWRKKILADFRIAPIIKTGEYIKLKTSFYLSLKKCLLIILSIFILLFHFIIKYFATDQQKEKI